MNGWDWQLVVTIVIVAGACVVLVRRAAFLLASPERSSCSGGGCRRCPATDSGVDNSIVQLDVADARLRTNSTETA